MGTLIGNSPSSNFAQLLKTESAINGTTLRTVEAGDGTQTPLQISTDKVKIAGSLEVTGAFITSNVATMDISGPSPVVNVTANTGNVSTVALGDVADADKGFISYDNTTNDMLLEVNGQAGNLSLRISPTVISTGKRINTSSILSGLNTTSDAMNSEVYIHVYDTAPVSPDKVTLPSTPVLGDTYIVSNSDLANAFNMSSSNGAGTINGIVGNQSLPAGVSRTYICVDATNKHWISIG
tara:strand:+ start:1403 stop:2116 length:714 start_codon:yes stop_codon:yes gene_type:complete